MNNPLFLNRGKGEGGNDELFRTFWSYWHHFQNFRPAFTRAALSGTGFAGINGTDDDTNGIGTPFFPDSIKTYNYGAGWVAEAFPFNALDYLLAVEGAFALRGSASRTLAASSRRFAAFPFVFETGEEMTDENGNRRKTARALWLPLWDRPTTWTELSSFICDAQARLPGKEARFSSEFARALRAQGVDAGFAGWQEFRFKMKGCKVPWVVTGAYIGPGRDHRPSLLADKGTAEEHVLSADEDRRLFRIEIPVPPGVVEVFAAHENDGRMFSEPLEFGADFRREAECVGLGEAVLDPSFYLALGLLDQRSHRQAIDQAAGPWWGVGG